MSNDDDDGSKDHYLALERRFVSITSPLVLMGCYLSFRNGPLGCNQEKCKVQHHYSTAIEPSISVHKLLEPCVESQNISFLLTFVVFSINIKISNGFELRT